MLASLLFGVLGESSEVPEQLLHEAELLASRRRDAFIERECAPIFCFVAIDLADDTRIIELNRDDPLVQDLFLEERQPLRLAGDIVPGVGAKCGNVGRRAKCVEDAAFVVDAGLDLRDSYVVDEIAADILSRSAGNKECARYETNRDGACGGTKMSFIERSLSQGDLSQRYLRWIKNLHPVTECVNRLSMNRE